MHLRRSSLRLLLLAAAAPACATLGVDPPEPLGYRQPLPASLEYAFQDSSVFSFDGGGMGPTEMLALWSGVADVAFATDTSEIRATVGFPQLRGRYENPGQAGVSADEGDIAGRFSVLLDPRGRVEVTGTPARAAGAEELVRPESLVRLFFVRLPARVVVPGERWTDTISTVEETDGLRTQSWQVITSTLAGDTTVGDRTLQRIRTETLNQVEVSGSTGGVEVLQRYSGETRGVVLWDAESGVLYAREEQGELSGSLELPGVSAESVPVEGRISRSVRLLP